MGLKGIIKKVPSVSTAEKVMEMPSVVRPSVLQQVKTRARFDQSLCWMAVKLQQSSKTMLTIAHDFSRFQISHDFLGTLSVLVYLLALWLLPCGSYSLKLSKTHAFEISQHGDLWIAGRAFWGPDNPT